jgi:acetyl esterase/lipase
MPSRLARAFFLLPLFAGLAQAQDEPKAEQAPKPNYKRTEDVIYGRKYGTSLTLDVFQPDQPNGVGLIFVVSGGWFSGKQGIAPHFIEPFLARGYTVFAVLHGSQPKFSIPEILEDMHRAVRYVRHHAKDYGVDPDRIGIYGGSAGGHLSLMQGTAGKEGKSDAPDPVDRESSRVQAVAAFFPPTDFLNYGKEGENALGVGILESFRAPFDFTEYDGSRNHFAPVVDPEKRNAIGTEISPINHASDDDPPTLLIHGDADKLVPIQQSEIMVEALKKADVPVELIVKPGAQHGWPDMDKDLEKFADWFDEHLKPVKP